MPDVSLYLFIINIVLGIAMYFMKQSHDNIKDQLVEQKKESKTLRDDISDIRDKYYKKEEFREFKEELWNRLDKMELTFERRLQGMKQ